MFARSTDVAPPPATASSPAAIAAATGAPVSQARFEVVKLTRPILTHSGQLTELRIPEPTARQVRRFGLPYRIIQEVDKNDMTATKKVESVIDEARCAKYIAELCGIDEPLLDQMSAPDFTACMMAVANLTSGLSEGNSKAS